MELTPERWRRIEALLDDVLEVPPDEQAAFLDRACPADLRPDLDALLAADAGVLPLLDDPAGHPVLTLFDAAGRAAEAGPDAWIGRQVGPWKIEEEVGRGGMGAVYRATRADGQFEQTAALKRLGYGGPGAEAVRRRFLQERQILARLQHPNIARLLDGGVTAEGSPYLVMEYVEGEPITTYCDRHRLPVEARLRLCEAVCEAVQYAHQQFVVHRDLKPSNVLVTAGGHVKLLDFGIAKLLDPSGLPDEPGGAPLTQTGGAVMTPEYAAPEQVRGEAVSTATDVYALGVLLFELLTGHRPYVFESRAPGAVERVVCEAEPARPSTVVGRARERRSRGAETRTVGPDAVSRARATSPDRLRRTLAGDLDTLVLKALRKEPERRYATAAQLAEDLRRYRAGRPLLARPVTVGYRARTFLRRHRLGVATGALVALLLLGGGTLYTVRVTAERDRARGEAAKAEAVTEYLVGLFEASDPSRTRGATVTARELLAAGQEQIERLEDQPAVQARMLEAVGRVYLGLGLGRDAEPLLRRALTVRRSVYAPAHPEVAASLHHLGAALIEAGRYLEADSLLRQALAVRRALHGPGQPEVAASVLALARAVEQSGEPLEAAPLYREALALQEARLGPAHPDVLHARRDLARYLRDADEIAAAELLFQAVLRDQVRVLGAEHPDRAVTMREYARLLQAKARLVPAEERGALGVLADSMLRRAITLQRHVLGPEHPEVARTLRVMGWQMNHHHDRPAADSLFRLALELQRRALGDEHPDVAQSLHDLGVSAKNRQQFDEAEPLLREALALRRRVLGDEHPALANTAWNLGSLLHQTGRPTEAEPLLREALTIARRSLPEHTSFLPLTLVELGATLWKLERYDEAESALLEAHRRINTSLNPEPMIRLAAHNYLIVLYASWGRPEQVIRYAEEGIRAASAEVPGHWTIGRTYRYLGEALTELGRYAEAEEALLASRDILKVRYATSVVFRKTREALARLYVAWDQSEQPPAAANRAATRFH